MFNSNVKVGDKLYLHNSYARHGEKPIKELTVIDILPRLKCVGFFDYHHNY